MTPGDWARAQGLGPEDAAPPEPPTCSGCHRDGLRSVRFMGMQATAYPQDYDPNGDVAAYAYVDEEIWLCRACRQKTAVQS